MFDGVDTPYTTRAPGVLKKHIVQKALEGCRLPMQKVSGFDFF